MKMMSVLGLHHGRYSLRLPPLALLWLLLLQSTSQARERTPVTVMVLNDSTSKLYMQWVNPHTGELVELCEDDDPMYPTTVSTYHSFAHDEFVVYERGADCDIDAQEQCRRTFLKIPKPANKESDEDEQELEEDEKVDKILFIINSWFQVRQYTDKDEIDVLLEENEELHSVQHGDGKHYRKPESTVLYIYNDSERSFVDIYWINSEDGSLVKETDETPLLRSQVDEEASRIAFNTLMGNQFLFKETYGCVASKCRNVTIEVPYGPKESEVMIVGDFEIMINGQLMTKKDENGQDVVPVPVIMGRNQPPTDEIHNDDDYDFGKPPDMEPPPGYVAGKGDSENGQIPPEGTSGEDTMQSTNH